MVAPPCPALGIHWGALHCHAPRHSLNCGFASAARHCVIRFRMTSSVFHVLYQRVGPFRNTGYQSSSPLCFRGPPLALDEPY